MSSPNPYQSGEGHGDDQLSSNPYASRYHRAEIPDLDAAAPQLRSQDLKRMNQRALILLAAVVLLLLCVAYWLISSRRNSDELTKPREERVTVAEAPRPLAMPPPIPNASMTQPQRLMQAEAIPVLPKPVPLETPVSTSLGAPSHGRAPSLIERRMTDTSARTVDGVGETDISPTNTVSRAAGATSAHRLRDPDTLMQRGAYIRCVLETRINSDIAGFTSCLVTEPLYSLTGRQLLLPKGSKVLGSYQTAANVRRIEVVWDRIITPTGVDVNMASPGIDNLGGAGIPGHYDAHWGSRVASAMLISLLSDAFKYAAAEHGPGTTTISNGQVTQSPFESNTAQTAQALANQAVQAAANRPATLTINQGSVVYVYVAKDVDFSGVIARN